MYSSIPSLISALDGVGCQRHAPTALPLGKARYPLYRRLVGPQGQSGQVRKISPPSRIPNPLLSARNESLYRLRLTVPHMIQVNVILCSSKTHVQRTEQHAGLDVYVNTSSLGAVYCGRNLRLLNESAFSRYGRNAFLREVSWRKHVPPKRRQITTNLHCHIPEGGIYIAAWLTT